MAQYLVAIHRPNSYDSSVREDEAMGRAIDELNEEMVEAGVRVFVGGLRDPSEARSLQVREGGEVLVTNGPYLPSSEHVGGFWVLDVATPEEAMEWGRRAAIACRAPVEVRPFH